MEEATEVTENFKIEINSTIENMKEISKNLSDSAQKAVVYLKEKIANTTLEEAFFSTGATLAQDAEFFYYSSDEEDESEIEPGKMSKKQVKEINDLYDAILEKAENEGVDCDLVFNHRVLTYNTDNSFDNAGYESLIIDAFINKKFNSKIPHLIKITNPNIKKYKFIKDILPECKIVYFCIKNLTLPINVETGKKEIFQKYFSVVFEYKNFYIRYNSVQEYVTIIYHGISMAKHHDNIATHLAKYYEKPKTKLTIQMVMYKPEAGFYLSPITVDKYMDDIFDNYNEDLKEVFEVTKKALTETSKGVAIFHGDKGSGKTTFIRFLVNYDFGKKIIFLPSSLSNSISEPNFMTFLTLQCKNSIFILEDAEDLVTSRESKQSFNKSLSDVLQMTDGIMNDNLKTIFILTFNTSLDNIDSALLRAGRLIAEYRFSELTEDRAIALYKKLGKEPGSKRMLCDIYNDEPPRKKEETKKIGF